MMSNALAGLTAQEKSKAGPAKQRDAGGFDAGTNVMSCGGEGEIEAPPAHPWLGFLCECFIYS